MSYPPRFFSALPISDPDGLPVVSTSTLSSIGVEYSCSTFWPVLFCLRGGINLGVAQYQPFYRSNINHCVSHPLSIYTHQLVQAYCPKLCPSRMPHAIATRMPHVLDGTDDHEQWKRVTIVACSGPRTGAIGESVSSPTSGLQKGQ